MSQHQEDLRNLLHLRRCLIREFSCGVAGGAGLIVVAFSTRVHSPETFTLLALALVVFSIATIRGVANTLDVLELPCPTCSDPFFGGLQRAAAVLPLPPRACVGCGTPLETVESAQTKSSSRRA